MDCINTILNTKITKIRLFYTAYHYYNKTPLLTIMHNFKFHDKDNNKIDVYYIIKEKPNLDDIFIKLESLRENGILKNN